jgi:predicted AlkP superfamily phosphohydrolase/phosphomutase
MAEGCLPTFERLIARGTINRLMPSIPAWTPTNWAAQITGAHPGTHGLGGWTKHRKADSMDIPPIESWESRDWQGETVWDVAEEVGYRCLITHYPVGVWPSPIRNGYVIGPGLRYPPFVLADPGEYYCSAQAETAANQHGRERVRSVDEVEEGGPPGSIPVRLRRATGWRHPVGDGWEGELRITDTSGSDQTLFLLVRAGALDRPGVWTRKDADGPLLELELGRWSPFARLCCGDSPAEVGSVRFRLLAAGPGPALHLCRSQIYATAGFAYPAGLAEELVAEVGPFFTSFSLYPRGPAELEAFLDDVSYQGHWQARVARYVQERHGWDLHFCHWHIFDNVNHPTVNAMDPEGPAYSPEAAAWHTDAQRRCYRIADEVLAEFLEAADDDTVVMVVSDHAMPPAHRWADVNARLAECGLMAFEPATRRIDLSRSMTYTWPGRGAEVFVNLAGREPTGVVPPDRYEAVQDRILDALLDWRDPATGQRVMALALRLQDAQIIGYWGQENGDVICVFNHGMGWGEPVGGGSVGPGRGALHGSQLPTYETPLFTTMGMMILAGPGIRGGGYERDWQRWGLIREIDVAPTICHLMGLRAPAQNQGAVPHDLLD